MTMTASRTHENSPNVKVQMTYGAITASIEENYQHLRHFQEQLGRLLDEVEASEKAKVTDL